MMSGVQRSGRAKINPAMLYSESEYRAEMHNKTEQNRLEVLLQQMTREERICDKKLNVARKQMENYADNLSKRRKSSVHYMSSNENLGEKRQYKANQVEDAAPGGSVFLTEFYPRYLWQRASMIPDDHEHPGGVRLVNCPICTDISRLVRDYINWKKSTSPSQTDFLLKSPEPSLPSTPQQSMSRHGGLHLTKPVMVRKDTRDTISEVFLPKRAAHDCIYTPVPPPSRPPSQLAARLANMRSHTNLEDYIGRGPVIKGKLRSFLHGQKTFNAKNPVPQNVKQETESSQFKGQMYIHKSQSAHKTKGEMISETLKMLRIKPSDYQEAVCARRE